MKGTQEERYARRTLVARLMQDALEPFDGPSVVAAVEFRREQYGLIASEMAEILGLTKGHYSEFVLGKRALPAFAAAMAFRIGVPAECLFQMDAPPWVHRHEDKATPDAHQGKGNFMAQFRVKFVVVSVTVSDHPTDPARGVTMRPVTSGSEENKSFSKYTPSGQVDLYVTNPNLFPILDEAQGKEFYVDFTEAPK